MTNEDLKAKAEKFFKGHQFVRCPAFPHDKVYLNSKGLNHLFYKGGNKARTHKEVSVRVELLDRAIRLLELMPLAQEEDFIYVEEDKKRKKITFWAFEGVMDGKRIKVIVRRKGDKGNKLFWSVIPAWRKPKFGERRNSKGNLSGV